MGDGYWTDRCDNKDVRGSVTRIGPVFQRDVTYADGDGWTCTLNGEAMGGYPRLAGAKAQDRLGGVESAAPDPCRL